MDFATNAQRTIDAQPNGATPTRKQKARIAVFVGFDARVKGGLTTMAGSFIDALDALGIHADLYMPRLLAEGRVGPAIVPISDGKREWLTAGTVPGLPNFAAPLIPAVRLRGRMRRYDLVQSIVGSGVWSLPGLAARRNACWVATPFQEEFHARISAGRAGSMPFRALRAVENYSEGAVLRGCDHVLALSENTRDTLMSRHALDPSRISLLYAPIDELVFYPSDVADVDEVFVTTSRLDDERKDVPALVRAFAIVATARPTARLRLIGPYAADGPVARAVAASSARDRIDLVGELDRQRVGGVLRGSRVFVLPSRQEGLGIVALEAMACGLPVVAYSNGGTDEVINSSGAGILIASRTDEALANAMLRVMSDDENRAAARRRAIDFVIRRASSAVFRDNIATAYERLGLEIR